MNIFRKPSIAPRRRFALVLALIHGLTVPLTALAQVVPASGKTNVFLAPNGVPVVNIETANAAGLSHNRYSEFNVDGRGLIFNNGNSSQMARDAELARQVMANLNLRAEASVILNEVVVANRSTLAGYMEVLGSRADVIIANPWGITCSGCGFINTPRATLTTGTANIGVDGGLTGFDVNRGDVLVNGGGLDGKTVDILDIVARSIRLDGQVNGKDLRLTAGANRYGYAGRDATAIAGSGAAPTLAIDSSVLGGMYANRIKLVATEAGVGVRMLGDAAATADDMHLDAAGAISIQSRISAERDVRIASTAAGADAIRLASASLAGKHDLALSTTLGGITMDGATGNNLYAGNTLSAAGNGGLALADARLLAESDVGLSSAAGGITITSGGDQRVQSTGGNVTLVAAGNLNNAGYIAADVGSVDVALGGGLTNPGTLFAKTGMTLQAATGLDNSGSIAADTASLSARIGGALANSGSLYAKTALTVTDNSGAATENLDNSGTVLSDGTLSLAAAGIVNTGGIQGGQNTTVSAVSLDNSGKLIGASQAGATTTLTLGSLLNRAGGVIQATRDMTVNATTSLSNSGNLLSSRNLVLQGRDAGTTLAVSNASGAVIQAGETLTLRGAAGGGNASLDNQGGTLLADTLAFNLASLGNSGIIQGGNGASSLVVSGTLDNRTGATLTLAGDSGTGNVSAGILNNAGRLQSRGNATLSVASQLNNSGNLIGSRNLVLQGRDVGTTLAIANTGGGLIQADGTLTLQGASGGGTATLDNQNGSLLGDTLVFNLGSLGNSGTIQGGNGASSLVVSGTLDNRSGATLTLAGDSGTGNVSAGILNNAGRLQSRGNATLSVASQLNNSGNLIGSRNLVLQGRDVGTTLAIVNASSALIQAGGALTLQGASGGNATLDNQGGSLLGDTLAFNLSSLANSGTIQGGAGASSVAVGGTLDNRSGATMILSGLGGSASVSANSLDNAGQMQSSGNATLSIGSQLNNSGTLLGDADLNLTGGADALYSIDNSGVLRAAGLLAIKGYGGGKKVNLALASTGVVLGGVLDINAGSVSLADGARLSSVANLNLLADTLSMAGSGAKVLAATGGGNGVITLANGLANNGMLYSGGNLTISAASVANSDSGGIVALDTLTVGAASGDINNAGAIYGGNQVNLNAAGTFTNVGYADRGQGTVDSDGGLSISAGTFINQSSINAARNLTINAPTFKNEVAGGDTRVWVFNSNYASSTHTDNWYSFPDNYSREYHTNTWTDYQTYSGGKPTFKPRIIGGDSVTIQGFNSGANIGGVISGTTLNLVGNGGGATFVNDNLALSAKDYRETYDYYTHYIALGPAKYTDHQYGNYAKSLVDTRTIDSLGSVGLYATTLNAGGFALTNNGGPYAAGTNAPAAQSAPSGGTLAAAAGGASLAAAVAGGAPTAGAGPTGLAATLSFGGITVKLPSNPNGYFVVSKAPNSRYLVETNPLFGVGQNFVGSHYLEQRYGYNPDTVQKHLGDANYEGWLIRQQLVAQTGRNIMVGYASEADQMRRMLDNAYAQSGSLGLTYGAAPTPEQLANLTQDMVWMVSQTVNGQQVLAPVVYLAQSTRDSLESGAAIAGGDVNLNLTRLANVGGTLSGKNSLSVVSQGDITNTSGKLKGGNVALTSTAGSIINQTLEEGDRARSTALGRIAGIEATGNLGISAAKDVIVKGAKVDAGGNAAIAAAGNVTFDTVEKVATDTTFKSDAVRAGGMTLSSSSEVKTTTTAHNVGSNLTTGGKLAISSGKDITIAGSKVKAGGDLDMDAQGDVNIVARQDRTTTHTESHQQGLGVGGGLWGSKRVVKDEFEGINFAASTAAGGNARIKAGNTLRLEGSDLSVAGDAGLNAKDILILAGKDEKRSHTETETLTLISGATSKTGSSSGTEVGAKAQGREASASASASAEANADAQVKLFSARKEKTDTRDVVSRGSTLNIGGSLKAKADNNITLQGAEATTGGDLKLDGRNVEILAAQDVHETTTRAEEVSLNLSSANKAGAKAEASAQASGKKLSASAEASAKASASTDNVIGVAIKDEKSGDLTITNKRSVLKSGGNLELKAKETLTLQAADITAAGDANLEARDIRSLAADDVHRSTSEAKTTTVGVYVAAEASAEAEAHAKANVTSASVGASAEAKVEAGYGLHVGHETEKTSKGGTTAQVTTIKAGGNLTRKAENKIEDVGSNLEAGGDFFQSAREIDMRAARDTRYDSSETDSHVARVGQYASASAGASAQAGVGTTGAQAGANANAKAIAGFKAGYQNDMENKSSSESTAVVGQIKSGGKLTSISSGKTSMEGSKLASGGDVELSASQLDYRAARNTQSSFSETRNIDASIKVGGGVGASAGTEGGAKAGFQAEGSLSFDYGTGKEAASASQAVVGGIASGGKLKVATTQGDMRFEGTNIDAAGDIALASKGNLIMDAARDEKRETSKNTNVGFGVSVEAGAAETSGEGSLNVGHQEGFSRSSTARVGTVKSGGNLSIAAGKDAVFEGAKLEAAGDAAVEAGGNATFKGARNIQESSSLDVDASLSGGGSKEKGKKGSGEGELGLGFGYGSAYKLDSVAAGIKSGGKTKVAAAGDVNLEGDVVSRDKIQAGGKVNSKALEKVDNSFDIGFSATIGVEKGGDDTPDKGKGAKEATKAKEDSASGKKKPTDADTPTKPAAKKTDTASETPTRKKGELAADQGKDGKEAVKPAQDGEAGKKKSADTDEPTKPALKKADVATPAPSSPPRKPVSMDEARTKGWRGEDGKWIWPSNDGFKGEPKNEALKVGATIDRFGSDKGTFFAPAGTPLAERAMAPDTVGKDLTLTKFEVLKPLPVAVGEIAPWFDQPGGGTQYKATMSAEELVKQGYLKKIEVHQDVKVDELVKKGVIK